MPKISVLIPYYNDSKFLAESIGSVLEQSFSDFELILINHASTDESRNVAGSFSDSRIKHIDLEVNQGAGGGHILQAALAIAVGEFFKTFCADDVMLKGCLETLLRTFEVSDKDFDLVFGNMDLIDNSGKCLADNWWKAKNMESLNLDEIIILKKFLKGDSFLPYPAALVRTDSLRNIKIDQVIHGQFDMTLWVQILGNGGKIKLIQESVCEYRIHPSQASSSSKKALISQSSFFESMLYCEYFIQFTSVEIVNKLIKTDLKKDEANMICCAMALYFSKSEKRSFRIYGLLRLRDFLSNSLYKEILRIKFGYILRDFRRDYLMGNFELDLKSIRSSKFIKILIRRFKILFKLKKKEKLTII